MYIKSRGKVGIVMLTKGKVKVVFSTTPDVLEWLNKAADNLGMTRSGFLSFIVRNLRQQIDDLVKELNVPFKKASKARKAIEIKSVDK
jgi:hypothetical protein